MTETDQAAETLIEQRAQELMDEDSRTEIWEAVSTTPPTATKTSNVDGRSQTSINGTWFYEKATELFGPCGKGWGFDILEERYDAGHDVFDDQGNTLGQVFNHTIQVKLWYENRDQYIISFGHTKSRYWVRNGQYWKTDEEAPKKSLTDAIKKALSLLGFAADVYSGMYDDQAYLEVAASKESIDKAVDKVEAAQEEAQKYTEKLERNLETMKASTNLPEFETIYKALIREAKARKNTSAEKLIVKVGRPIKEKLMQSDGAEVQEG